MPLSSPCCECPSGGFRVRLSGDHHLLLSSLDMTSVQHVGHVFVGRKETVSVSSKDKSTKMQQCGFFPLLFDLEQMIQTPGMKTPRVPFRVWFSLMCSSRSHHLSLLASLCSTNCCRHDGHDQNLSCWDGWGEPTWHRARYIWSVPKTSSRDTFVNVSPCWSALVDFRPRHPPAAGGEGRRSFQEQRGGGLERRLPVRPHHR